MVAGSRFWISRPSKTMRPALGQDREVRGHSVDVGRDGVTIAADVRAHGEVLVHRQMWKDSSPLWAMSDTVIVLDHGAVIAEGAPAVVQSHPDVIRAYLGASRAED